MAAHQRTPAQLDVGDIIAIDGNVERVLRTNRVLGRWMIRTDVNLHRRRNRDRVEVLATFVPGLGYVEPLAFDLST